MKIEIDLYKTTFNRYLFNNWFKNFQEYILVLKFLLFDRLKQEILEF